MVGPGLSFVPPRELAVFIRGSNRLLFAIGMRQIRIAFLHTLCICITNNKTGI